MVKAALHWENLLRFFRDKPHFSPRPPPPRFACRVKFPTVFHGIDLANVNPSKVVDVERCHIATDGINVALPPAREAARKRVDDAFSSGQGKRVGKRGATLLFRETTEQGTVTDNTADVSERVDGMVFNFKVGAQFFSPSLAIFPTVFVDLRRRFFSSMALTKTGPYATHARVIATRVFFC